MVEERRGKRKIMEKEFWKEFNWRKEFKSI